MEEKPPEYITVPEVGRILRVSRQRAYQIVAEEGFPLLRLGRTLRVSRKAFDEWLRKTARAQALPPRGK